MKTFSLHRFAILTLLLALSFVSKAQQTPSKWLDNNSVYRVSLSAAKQGAQRANIYWRLPFKLDKEAGVSVYERSSGLRVERVFVRSIDEDMLEVAFDAAKEGIYEIYLLPEKPNANTLWADKLKLHDYPKFRELPSIINADIESRICENPYDVAATRTQSDYFFSNTKELFVARIVPAEYPLNTNSRLPELWLGDVVDKNTKEDKGFVSKIFQSRQAKNSQIDTILIAPKGKTFIQVGLLATKTPQKLSVRILPSNDGAGFFSISESEQNLKARELRSWWAVADVSEAVERDFYNFKIVVSNENGDEKIIPVVLKTDRSIQSDPFVEDILRMSVGGVVLEKFKKDLGAKPDLRFPVTLSEGYNVKSGANALTINTQTSLPKQIYSDDRALLSMPVLLVFMTDNGLRKIGVNKLEFTRKTGGVQAWQGEIKTHDMHVRLTGSLNAHSLMQYRVEVLPLSDIAFRDITLEFAMAQGIDQVAWGDEQLTGSKNIALYPRDGQYSFWLGNGGNGMLLSLPDENDNILRSNNTSSIKIYKSGNTSVIVSSGDFIAKKDRSFSLVYDFQLFPADFAREKGDFEYIYFARDTVPSFQELAGAKILVLESSCPVTQELQRQKLRQIHRSGVEVVATFEGFNVACDSEQARVLSSMGFANTVNKARDYINFEYSDTLASFFVDRYKWLISQDYIDGVLLSDDPFNTANAELLSALGREKKPEFMLYLKTSSGDAGALSAAPWIDKVFVSGDQQNLSFSSGSGIPVFVLSEADDPYTSLINRNVPSLSSKDSHYGDVTRKVWALAQSLDLYKAKYFSPTDPKIPVKCSNNRINTACYVFDDRLVVVLKNNSEWAQDFSLDFDWKSLGIERWQVDELIAPQIDGVQSERKLFLNTPIDIAPNKGLVIMLKWTKK